MRPLVSYDDISWPETATKDHSSKPQQPPSKKQKKSNQKPKIQPHRIQHWDDPGSPDEAMSYGDDGVSDDIKVVDVNKDNEEEESRELTYEEIWDDSALINAWNAATEEYETYHGTDKNWKKEPVNKSPLWYNVPPPSNLQTSKIEAHAGPMSKSNAELETMDSQPLDFDTFVPDHDPSLAPPVLPFSAAQAQDRTGYYLPDPPGSVVSQDEAFARALDAMYWAGYYSAVYHCRRNNMGQKRPAEDEGSDQDDQTQINEEGKKI